MIATTLHTAHGFTVTIRRVGLEYDLQTANTRGDVISTVRMSEPALTRLLDEAEALVEWVEA